MDGPRLTRTSEVCAEGYLNSPFWRDGNRDFSLEKYFNEIETKAASYWEEVTNGTFQFDDPVERKVLSEFIAALHLRNKYVADNIRKIHRLTAQLFGGPTKVLDSGRRDGIMPFENDPDPTDPDRFFAQSTRKDIPRITEVFFGYRWTLIKVDDVLVTSDRPVTFDTPGERPSGPGDKEAIAIVPVSPHAGLLMQPGPNESTCTKVEELSGYCGQLNSLICRKAERFVLSSTDSFALA